MKHKKYEMIVAKASNMDLVVFVKGKATDTWVLRGEQSTTTFFYDVEYFLCLPQHKDACLHWLNGGEVQDLFEDNWSDCGGTNLWEVDHMFMNDEAIYRIKPKKEKRWIGVFKENLPVSGRVVYKNTEISYETLDDLKRNCFSPNGFDDWQFIEIEVEV